MTQDELKAAVLAALIDYETLKKTRRLKAVKKALHGTVVATVIGSAGLTAANQTRSKPVQEEVVAAAPKAETQAVKHSHERVWSQMVSGVAHFGSNRHTLATAHKDRLMELVNQLPEGAKLIVIGRTDSSGSYSYNKKLGKKRARAVANYLAHQGVKIKAIGSKVSSNSVSGWTARGVDIIVSYSSIQRASINLPPLLVKQQRIHRAVVSHPAAANARATPGSHAPVAHTTKSVAHKLRSSQFAPPVKKAVEPADEGMQWWDDKSKVNDSRLDKTSWAEPSNPY